MSQGQRRKILLSVTLLVALLAIALTVTDIHLDQAWQSFKKFSPSTLGLVLLASSLQIVFMILRFWALFFGTEGPGLLKVSQAIAYGHFFNSFAPARAGEAVKVVLLSRGHRKIQILSATGLFVADKVADLSALLGWYFFSGAYRTPGLSIKPEHPETFILIAMAAAIVVTILIKIFFRKHLEKIKAQWEHLLSGLKALCRPQSFLPSLAFAALCWGSEIWAIQTLCAAQGFTLSIDQIVCVLVILNLAISVAVSVGNLGTFEASLVFAVGKFGVAMEQGVAIALCHHVIQWGAIFVVAGIVLLLSKLLAPIPKLPGASPV